MTVQVKDARPHPLRIQRKRIKGYRMPEGAVYVGRPTIWGNPFWHVAKFHGVDKSLVLFRDLAHGVWNPAVFDEWGWPDSYVSQVYDTHRAWSDRFTQHPVEVARTELRGKQLACWCSLDSPCHADILAKVANDG